MFPKRYLWQIFKYCKHKQLESKITNRSIHTTTLVWKSNEKSESNEIALRLNFENIETKTRHSYLEMVKIFTDRDVHRRGHVEFIYSALKNMDNFDVQKDLEVYKALIDVMPKGKFIPQNIFQAEFMHYPKQQQCIVDLLQQMEDNGVMPDYEMEDMLLNIFGKRGHPVRKFWRMMYWMPKFKNLSPWIVPNPPPNDALELAKLAIERIASVDVLAAMTIYQTSDIQDSIEDTWIVSSQSPIQKKLLTEHKSDEPIYVEGSFKIWLRNKAVNYFVLRGSARPFEDHVPDLDDVSNIKIPSFNEVSEKNPLNVDLPTVHEQEDGVIYSVCATGTSSKDSLLSWIRHLEKDNPQLTNSPIVFTLRTAEKEVAQFETKNERIDEH